MSECRVVPGLLKIIVTDYWCLLLALAPVISVALVGMLAYSGRMDLTEILARLSLSQAGSIGDDGILPGIAVLLVAFCPPLLLMRVRGIRRIFREGVETDGEVVFFRKFRDRGRIEFEFEHNDEIFRGANPVHLTRAVNAVCLGQHVTVVYLPNAPKSAVIKEIYQ